MSCGPCTTTVWAILLGRIPNSGQSRVALPLAPLPHQRELCSRVAPLYQHNDVKSAQFAPVHSLPGYRSIFHSDRRRVAFNSTAHRQKNVGCIHRRVSLLLPSTYRLPYRCPLACTANVFQCCLCISGRSSTSPAQRLISGRRREIRTCIFPVCIPRVPVCILRDCPPWDRLVLCEMR